MRERRVARVNERNQLLAQIGVVAAGARRIDELAAAERCPAVHHRNPARRDGGIAEQRIDELNGRQALRTAVAPHVELTAEALDEVDDRKPARVVAWGRVHPERPYARIAERVAAECDAVHNQLIEPASHRPLPWRSDSCHVSCHD
jgi:hypothetical protein